MYAVVGGTSYTFPETIAIDDADLSATVPSLSITGRDGELLAGRVTLKPSNFNASGNLLGLTKEAADALERDVKAHIVGKALKLYPTTDAVFYINCYVASVNCNFNRGKFNYGVLSMGIKFIALDPYKHLVDHIDTFPLSGSTIALSINNPGDVPVVPDFTYTSGGAYTLSGILADCSGRSLKLATAVSLVSGQVFKAGEDYALWGSAGVIDRIDPASLISPISLAPGANTVTVYGVNFAGTLSISFSPRIF